MLVITCPCFCVKLLALVSALKLGAEVTIPVTLKAWQLGLMDLDNIASKSTSGNAIRPMKDARSPMLMIHYAGPADNHEELPESVSVMPPGRSLVTPLNVCVFQGLSFVKARLLSMEIPAHVGEISDSAHNNSADNSTDPSKHTDRLVKIDPYRGSWGLRFLESDTAFFHLILCEYS